MSLTTNLELEHLCSKFGINLISCCCKDDLPRQFHYGSFIINLANKGDTGTHWVSFYTEKNNGKPRAVYFDSFGCGAPLTVQKYLNPCIPYTCNDADLQNINGGYCGWYCLMFLEFMQNNKRNIPDINKRFKAFLYKFKQRDPEANLTILKNRIKRIKNI